MRRWDSWLVDAMLQHPIPQDPIPDQNPLLHTSSTDSAPCRTTSREASDFFITSLHPRWPPLKQHIQCVDTIVWIQPFDSHPTPQTSMVFASLRFLCKAFVAIFQLLCIASLSWLPYAGCMHSLLLQALKWLCCISSSWLHVTSFHVAMQAYMALVLQALVATFSHCKPSWLCPLQAQVSTLFVSRRNYLKWFLLMNKRGRRNCGSKE